MRYIYLLRYVIGSMFSKSKLDFERSLSWAETPSFFITVSTTAKLAQSDKLIF